MTRNPHKIFSARWTGPNSGLVSLTSDWTKAGLPPLCWDDTREQLKDLRKAPPLVFGDASGYYTQDAWVTFCIRASRYPNFDLARSGVYVAGEFNAWNPNFNSKAWRLEEAIIGGQDYYLLSVQKDLCMKKDGRDWRGKVAFKFVTGRGEWMEVPSGAPNVTQDEHGNHNLYIHPRRSGHHQFFFTPHEELDPSAGPSSVTWLEDGFREGVLMMPGEYLHEVDSRYEQGVHFVSGNALFRIFAPRASAVTLSLFRKLDQSDRALFDAVRIDPGTWEAVVPFDCHGAYYYYFIDGERDAFSPFDPAFPILDPYALACVGPTGPAIALDKNRVKKPAARFTPPSWHDLVIAEAHVRDLAANAPVKISADERLGFTGLAKWVRSPDFYLSKLGVNAVELQPVQQHDEPLKDGYHWGYMTNNYFSPASQYALNPEKASQIDELRDLVAAFHERGLAVILDVVYNHVGEPNFLQYIDKHYYFDLSAEGAFMNWSGCGNTLNCATPMAYKLMERSLAWFVEAFDVDGFRFDLADLVGVEPLKKLEKDLKLVKPSIILIAEPWSFKGHIGLALKDSGLASWNDGYREYVRKYVLGQENPDGLKYFINGSLGHLSAWPAQSVNYVESHDDMCWLDRITTNDDGDGTIPSCYDRRRTHLMVAILMMSLGIPMLSAGQDFLRSKGGQHNTYKRGDLNALDYRRIRQFSGTHEYFRKWIGFRRSHFGRLLRLMDPPEDGYLRFFSAENGCPALGVLFNANGEQGWERLFFVVNPCGIPCSLDMGDFSLDGFTQVADAECFDLSGLKGAQLLRIQDCQLEIPAQNCALWVL
ncbi:MAG: glycoside hydrolase family 1 [Opitutales bacterium]|nr:glycoside hydrolase family 1 [Opitutales bacterium]